MNIKAFLLITIIATSSIPLMAQQARPSFKTTGTAVLFSVLIPGGGHFYAGESGKAVALIAIGFGSVVAGAVISGSADMGRDPFTIGVIGYLGTRVYGIADSIKAVRRANERNGYTQTSLRLVPIQTAISSPRPGLSFRMTF